MLGDAVDEIGVGALVGKKRPGNEDHLLTQAGQVGNADEGPLLGRAHIDEKG